MSTPDHENSIQNDITTNHAQQPGSDALYEMAVALITQKQTASISFLQRNLDIGYDDAAVLIERLENDNLIGKADGIHKRAVFINSDATKPGELTHED